MAKPKSAMPISISSSALKALDRLSASTDKVISVQSGIPKELLNAGKALDDLAQDVNKSVLKTYNSFVGLGQDYSAQEVNQILSLSQKNATQTKKNMQKVVADFKKSMSNNDAAQELVKVRKEYKASLYSSYDLIVSIIPKMRLALNTFANSIISPDDFSKRSLSVFFNEKNLTETDREEVASRLRMIIEKYGLEKELKEDVIDALVKGEKFWAVLSMNDELKGLLKESAQSKNGGYTTLEGQCRSMLNEHYATREETVLLEDGLELFMDADKKLTKERFAEDLDEFLSETFAIGKAEQFLSEHVTLLEEVENSGVFKIHDPSAKGEDSKDDMPDAAIDGLQLSSDTAVLKKLKAENIVKLEFDGKVYGYVYVDTITIDEKDKTQRTGSGSASPDPNAQPNLVTTSVQNVLYSSSDIDKGVTGEKKTVINDPKLMFIADTFVNRLSKKQNVKLLKKSEQLKYVVYHSLITRRITKDEKVRVLFFTPDEVVHIDRKQSIFDNVLFFAKLYIATLITILMQNIVRGADKRAYYVDIGLENDAANAINSVIRDIKTKELSNVHNMDLTSMLNVLGDFNDYYIPSIDGEKPIEIATVDGLSNVSLDNDFLNWLSNNIFSGIGLPAAYLTEVENIDFAKSLAMQNSRFIRDIVAEQVLFGFGYSELLRKLYMKEHGSELKEQKKANASAERKKEKSSIHLLNIESIEVKFPSPVSLNMTNMNDQINNLNTLVDSLTEVLDIKADDKDAATPIFKREMYKKYLPNLNWDEIDDIMAKVKRDLQESKIKKMSAPDSSPDDGSVGEDEPSEDA